MNFDLLLKFGFNQYQVQVYQALVSNRLSSASEVSRLSGIPQGRIYDVLESLVDKGLCTIYKGSIKKFSAVDPEIAFKSIFSERQIELDHLQTLQYEIKEQFDSQNSATNPLDFFQILSSKESQVQLFDELIENSQSSLIAFNKKPYATGFLRSIEEIKKSAVPLLKAMDRGVKLKAIFEAEYEHSTLFLQLVEYYESIGEEIRIVDELPIKMLIQDYSKGMVSLKSRDANGFKLVSMIIGHNDLLNALDDLFKSHWEKGYSIKTFKKILAKK